MVTLSEQLFKPYFVGAVEVKRAQIYSALKHINTASAFQSSDLRQALGRAGVPQFSLDRAADRLAQRCRKLGLLTFKHGHWWTHSNLSERLYEFYFPETATRSPRICRGGASDAPTPQQEQDNDEPLP